MVYIIITLIIAILYMVYPMQAKPLVGVQLTGVSLHDNITSLQMGA